MVDDSAGDSLEVAAGAVKERATEAFGVLGNETRLSILLELWDAIEPFALDNTVPFEALRERVGVDDENQFTYHLQKLTGHYVREADTGYELNQAGQAIIRTVVAGTGIEDPALEPTDLGEECPHCGGPLAVTYQDNWLCVVCPDCEGDFGGRQDMPEGMISGSSFPPAGMTDRTPEEMLDVSGAISELNDLFHLEGICSDCAGPMEGALHVCEDHDADGTCTACGRRERIRARFHCSVCKMQSVKPPSGLVWGHPAVISWCYERGVTYQWEEDEPEGASSFDVEETLEEDPLRVRVRIEYEGDQLAVTVDGELDIVAVEHPDP